MKKQKEKTKTESEIISYIRKHKEVKGVPKNVVDFYTEYRLNIANKGTKG